MLGLLHIFVNLYRYKLQHLPVKLGRDRQMTLNEGMLGYCHGVVQDTLMPGPEMLEMHRSLD